MEASEEFGGAQILQAFEALEDPRNRKCPYPLQELVLVALSGVTSGADDRVSVVQWGQLELQWLRRFLPFDDGVASHDTFSRVFTLLDAWCFEACIVAWSGDCARRWPGKWWPSTAKACAARTTAA